MKNLLFLLVFVSFTSFGQQKVYSSKEFEEKVMSIKESKHSYPTLGLIKLEDTKAPLNLYDVEKVRLIYDFLKFARSKNVRFNEFEYKVNHFVPIQLLFNADGGIDFFVYGFQNGTQNKYLSDSLSPDQESKLIEISEEFCKNYQLPYKINQKFNLLTNINLGNPPRKISKKYISTIEVAENCDKPDTVKSLMLNKLYLENFPQVVFKFKNLEKLDLSDNYIEKVPSEIWQLKKLKFLSLSGNYIDYEHFKFKRNKHLKDLNLQYTSMTKIPKSLKKNRRLEILFLGNNRIEFADRDFRRMTNLKALNLYNVQSGNLPKSIGKLQNLEELDLYHNNLQFLPKEVCKLANLKTLALSNNQLWNLPDEMAQMPKLQILYAHHNRLNSLPNLPNLKLLDLGYNLFKVFPEQVYELKDLEEFDITNNKVEEVPEKLLALKKLQKVYFRGNDFYNFDKKSKEVSKLVADLEQRQVLVR
ncbi:leucine-rich repeat domain-containing protein [Emticicia sp. SJ17W-69]|uniref:leucine-rich repeat domain-containing protein n=1 Tax=Emticicia sp. SJ17W-69 TaxID=3421657 RepID=UPI003EB9EE9A